MKILRLNCYYRLPDAFHGSLAAALRDLATFVEQPGELSKAPDTLCWPNGAMGAEAQAFYANVGIGIRFQGDTAMFNLEEGKPWASMPQERNGGFPCPVEGLKFRWAK